MTFAEEIYQTVKQIPKGKVATYGQVALMSGHRGAARAVGNALHVNPYPGIVPCHRVVNSQGRLAPMFAFGGVDEQKRMLEAEGVEVNDHTVDLEKYQWRGE
ncbi:MAG: MGMT family protein [Clostridiales bacterium]|nr:MGMT family protein [Clostridiales bacterium]